MFKKGHIVWNKGLTKETSLSLAIMANNKKGVSSQRKGHTKENDASIASMALKISEMKKGKQLVCNGWNKGLTRETDERVAKSFTPERNKKISNKLTGREITWGDKLSVAAIKRFENPSEREFVRQVMLRNFQNPDFVEKLRKARGTKPNTYEIKLQSILNEIMPDEWEFVGDGKKPIANKWPDFLNVRKRQIIEHYGRHWHPENPQPRIDLFKTLGYPTLIIYDNELKKINRDALKTKILNFSNGT